MNKRAALVAATLLAGLVAAVIGATAALRLIGTGSLGPGGKTLSEADIRHLIAQRSPAGQGGQAPAVPSGSRTSAAPPTSRSPGPSQRTATNLIRSIGGIAYASCSAGVVTMTGLIPAGGYGIDDSSPGPARSAWVRFKSASTEVTVTATCVNGKPHFATSTDDRGGGGGGGNGGGGSGH